MAVNKTEFTHAQGQIAVRTHLRLINEHAAGAVHGFYRKVHIINNGGVHVVFVMIPVAGTLPKAAVKHYGR